MPRTSPNWVRDTIEVPAKADLSTAIRRAGVVTDLVEAAGLSNSGLLAEIETLLAAHYYALKDPQYKEKKTGNASAVFMDRDWWGEAQKLDTTGTLANMADDKEDQSLSWGGLPVRGQTDWIERNGYRSI